MDKIKIRSLIKQSDIVITRLNSLGLGVLSGVVEEMRDVLVKVNEENLDDNN